MEAPPPPPPHGDGSRSRSGGLPDGNYDIFVIPPSSAGGGFLYLPSLQTQRNSFLAGCVCTATAFFFFSVAMPVAKDWFLNTVTSGGSGVLLLILGVGVVSWALGKTQGEGMGDGSSKNPFEGSERAYNEPRGATPDPDSGAGGWKKSDTKSGAQPQSPPPQPKPSWQKSPPPGGTDGKSAWEKAREETRKREEERKRAAEIQRRREALEKEKQRLREKETQEKLERELKEKKAKEEEAKAKTEAEKKAQREKEAKERDAREALLKAAKEAREARERGDSSPNKRPPNPSARTEREDDAYSFRPYDRPKSSTHKTSSGSHSVYSDDSYAPSATTAKTTPPASTRGPYSTKDPDKIVIKGVYSFNNAFIRTPISQLISGSGNVTDGLILRITTEGLFIDDDVRGVPQREWDIKAWTMKLAETTEVSNYQVLRASIRDSEGKKYVFILDKTEGWKVAVGLQRLRKGTQVRSLGVAGMPTNEARVLLELLGWS